MPFLNVTFRCGSPERLETNVLIRKQHQFVLFVQERLPEMPACRAYSARLVGLQLESLILAQNERWRHA